MVYIANHNELDCQICNCNAQKRRICRLTKTFLPILDLAERLPTSATLPWKSISRTIRIKCVDEISVYRRAKTSNMRKLHIMTKVELKTLVLPKRPAKLNETLRFKEYLILAGKDHPPGLYLRKLEEAKNTLRQNMFLQNWGQMIINNGALLG